MSFFAHIGAYFLEKLIHKGTHQFRENLHLLNSISALETELKNLNLQIQQISAITNFEARLPKLVNRRQQIIDELTKLKAKRDKDGNSGYNKQTGKFDTQGCILSILVLIFLILLVIIICKVF